MKHKGKLLDTNEGKKKDLKKAWQSDAHGHSQCEWLVLQRLNKVGKILIMLEYSG